MADQTPIYPAFLTEQQLPNQPPPPRAYGGNGPQQQGGFNNPNNGPYIPPNQAYNQYGNQGYSINQNQAYNQNQGFNSNQNQGFNPNQNQGNYPHQNPSSNPNQGFVPGQNAGYVPYGNPSIAGQGLTCMMCRRQTQNVPRKLPGAVTWIWCIGLFIFTGCLCCIPFCVDSCQDTEIVCLNCHCVKTRIDANCC